MESAASLYCQKEKQRRKAGTQSQKQAISKTDNFKTSYLVKNKELGRLIFHEIMICLRAPKGAFFLHSRQ